MSNSQFVFQIIKRDKKTRARTGILKTPHGEIHTPYFTPVATHAAVKTLSPDDLKMLGAETILANTYHLFLRPGSDLIAKFGGLHKFMNWQKPIMTDSGGFQVFSLGAGLEQGVGKIINFFPGHHKISAQSQKLFTTIKKRPLNNCSNWKIGPRKPGLVKIADEGVHFKSHLDGENHFLTPEKSIEIQKQLGADIIFVFDECTSPLANKQDIKKAMERTHKWAVRCLNFFNQRPTPKDKPTGQATNPEGVPPLAGPYGAGDQRQCLFGIVQGGAHKDLRTQSAKFIASLPFSGFGIGGTLGKTKQEMKNVLNWCVKELPENKPRHLLGIGEPKDILLGVEQGMDLFDCVMPTRLARHGVILTKKGKINIAKSRYKNSKNPLDNSCKCHVCQNFCAGYLHHLFRCGEILAHRLLTYHNLYFILNFMEEIRTSINNGKFSEYKNRFAKEYK